MKPPDASFAERLTSALRTIGSFVGRRLGWSRVGAVVSLAIIAVAVVALYHILSDIQVSEVLVALKRSDWNDIALAAVFVACAYFTLTFYDLFALRTIGHSNIPYRIAALGAFTSYSVGHNVGASVFTGGAVRYRIYSSHGLDGISVAKVCFLAGLTFWLGNAAVLGLGVLYTPQSASAIDQLPPWFNRSLAVAVLIILAIYVRWVWRRPRVIGHAGWRVALPEGPLTLLQILIGILDLSFCALAMYTLVPDEPNISFITLGVIFVSATLLGFASHAPGGLGVFDAAMLVALWQFDKEDLLAGLLLFRLLYYIVPLALSLLILGTREVMLSVAARRRRALQAHAEQSTATNGPPPPTVPMPSAAPQAAPDRTDVR